MGLNDNRKMPSDVGGYQQKPRGWTESNYGNSSSSQMHPRGSSSEWNEDNDWRGAENEKNPQWSAGGNGGRERSSHQQPQRAFSPPNGVTGFRNVCDPFFACFTFWLIMKSRFCFRQSKQYWKY